MLDFSAHRPHALLFKPDPMEIGPVQPLLLICSWEGPFINYEALPDD